MNRYKLELDKVTVPENTVDSLMTQAAAPRRKTSRRVVVLAACLAVLCALSIGAVARYYTGWEIGEVTRFDYETYLAEREESGWDPLPEATLEWLKRTNGNYEIRPKAEHGAVALEEETLKYLRKIAMQDGQIVEYASVEQMSKALEVHFLNSPLLIAEDCMIQFRVAPLDNAAAHLQLSGGITAGVKGTDDIFCTYDFSLYTRAGADSPYGISCDENTYVFSQIELTHMQVIAECVAYESGGEAYLSVYFTKDDVLYCFSFWPTEKAKDRPLNMDAVMAVLESLE